MPDSKKTKNNAKTVTPSRRQRQWDTDLTEGPKTLYEHFVAHALDERMPELDTLDDATRLIVFDAVKLAVDVVTTAAAIAPTWDGLYVDIMRSLPRAKAA